MEDFFLSFYLWIKNIDYIYRLKLSITNNRYVLSDLFLIIFKIQKQFNA